MRIGPLLKYFCSTCGTVLKESSSLDLPNDQLKEECPSCGSLLVETLQNRRLISSLRQQEYRVKSTQNPADRLSSDFQTAQRQIEAKTVRLAFDIEKLDSLLNLSSYGVLLVTENAHTCCWTECVSILNPLLK